MPTLAFLDTETTGLDPDRHEVWEVGLILRTEQGTETEHQWQLPVDLSRADPMALNIGRFHDRRLSDVQRDDDLARRMGNDKFAQRVDNVLMGAGGFVVPAAFMTDWARTFVDLTRGAHLVGAVVSFDADRLWRLLRRLGECPMWHYHLIDVEALAAGWIAADRGAGDEEQGRPPLGEGGAHLPPWSSEELSSLVGVPPDKFDRHTALGDAAWARAIYDAVLTAEQEGLE